MANAVPRPDRARVVLCVAAVALMGACTGQVPGDRGRPDDGPPDPSRPGAAGGSSGTGTGGGSGVATGGAPAAPPVDPLQPPIPPPSGCEPTLDRRVTRLSDRHLENAIGALLATTAPEIETGALAGSAFLPGKPAPVTGAVATKLQDVAETVAVQATAAGKPAIACTGSETDCARAFVDRFASRAFRRPITEQERTELMAVYSSGKTIGGTHAGGISLVIEAVLQSPSFVYLTELGVAQNGVYKLTPYELAAKLSLFLRDSLPDEPLWQAASTGKLATDAGIAAEVDRLMELPDTKVNLSRMYYRFFDLESLPAVMKGTEVRDWTATLAKSLYAESTRFVDDILFKKNGTLKDLLTSRHAVVDKAAATLYGVTFTGTATTAEVTLPEHRAGILTRAGLMAVKAEDHDTSVVFRGLMVARGFLCLEPPPPPDSAGAVGEMLRETITTERGRAEARLMMDACKHCHQLFDPFGVNFEHYDTVGKYRTTIATSKGTVPVNAAWDIKQADIEARITNGVELSQRLADSKTARQCMTQQIAAYAFGERLPSSQTCGTTAVAERWEASGGSLKTLIKEIALWHGLRNRREGVAP